MRVLVLLIYAVVGFILWRAVGMAVRMVRGSTKPTDGRVRGRHEQPAPHKDPFSKGQIKEAEFEDLTPPRKEDQQSPPR
jgi:hypothetical protein